MIVYLDSSVLARAYLADEAGHDEVLAMLEDPELDFITGTWTWQWRSSWRRATLQTLHRTSPNG